MSPSEAAVLDAPPVAEGRLHRALLRARTRWRGALRRSAAVSEAVGVVALADYWLRRGSVPRRLGRLLVAARRLQTRPGRVAVGHAFRPWLQSPTNEVWREQRIGWERYYAGFGGLDRTALTTSLLIKAPGANGEKGVLYSSFEYNWIRLIQHHDARRFFDEYLLVGASSGAALDYAAYASLAGLSPDPIFIGVSNPAQVAEFAALRPVIQPLPIMASDWVNPDAYTAKPLAARQIDVLMVANWLSLKRHWILFEALRGMDPKLRVVLIGRNAPGRTEREVRAEARAFGVRQDLELRTNVSVEEVIACQCDARVSAIFSDREGSCVSTAECLFADTPVVMMRDAYVGSKAYINDATGAVVRRGEVARALERLLDRPASVTPRAWALANIGCHRASERLNATLRDYCRGAGQPWTRDITPLEWRYVPRYIDSAHEVELAPAVDALRARHGVELVKWSYRPK